MHLKMIWKKEEYSNAGFYVVYDDFVYLSRSMENLYMIILASCLAVGIVAAYVATLYNLYRKYKEEEKEK